MIFNFNWYERPKHISGDLLPIKDGWGEWRTKTKKAHPIQFFFRESVPEFFIQIFFRLSQIMWAVIHRTTRRYHVIKPRTLSPGYHDPDERIRAAAFDIMSEYAEDLMGDGIQGTKWTSEDLIDDSDEGESFVKELIDQINDEAKIIELRNWWVEYRPQREKSIEDMLLSIDFDADDMNEKLEELWEFESKARREDEEQFIKLIKLLPRMWY